MAEPESIPPSSDLTVKNDEEKMKVKYLDFVRVATIYVIVCCSIIYEYGKENSGPLRSGVQTVEETVKNVIGPVFDKFHDVPFQLLMLVDRKVDQSIVELEHQVPDLLKLGSHQVLRAAHAASSVTQELASEVQQVGLLEFVYAKYKPIYAKYEPVAEQYAIAALNGLPFFSQLAHIMVPTAAYWADKYNQVVAFCSDRDYAVSYYLPLVPIQRIAKTFGPGFVHSS